MRIFTTLDETRIAIGLNMADVQLVAAVEAKKDDIQMKL